MEVISGGPNPQNLLHIRAVGTNSTLHYVWGTLGPPAVVLVATNTTQSVLSVNWSLLLSPDPDGGLMVLPKDSIQFSSALVFTRVRGPKAQREEHRDRVLSTQRERGGLRTGWLEWERSAGECRREASPIPLHPVPSCLNLTALRSPKGQPSPQESHTLPTPWLSSPGTAPWTPPL